MKLRKLFILLMTFISMSAYAQNDSSAVEPLNSVVKVRLANGDTVLKTDEVKSTLRSLKEKDLTTLKDASLPITIPVGTRSGAADTVSIKSLRRKN